uniref:Uncharacterized protein n=1 Tax=Myotis myotis TaxID=51298 RepID=A0A7J7XHY3_MYOMY|nr:hypothetical protein mMyoMyo1_011780 [Myotis myotis]
MGRGHGHAQATLPRQTEASFVQDTVFFFLIYFIDFLQRGRERDRELETSIQLPPAHSLLGMCPQPRYMPLTRIEPGTFQSALSIEPNQLGPRHRLWTWFIPPDPHAASPALVTHPPSRELSTAPPERVSSQGLDLQR